MKKLNLFLASMAVMAVMPTMANEVDFTYAMDNERYIWGTGKAEVYDVAIKIQQQSLVGSKVTGLYVPVPESDNLTNFSGWMTTELTLVTDENNKRVNAPNIASVSATPSNGVLSVTFAEPYTITEEGVYVGYSFEVTAATDNTDKNPVVVSSMVNDDALFLHTSRTYRTWKGYSSSIGASSTLTVVIDGDFRDNGAGIIKIADANALTNQVNKIAVDIANHGTKAIKELGYDYAIKSKSGTVRLSGHASTVLETPVEATFNAPGTFYAEIPAYENTGGYVLEITITDVNGEKNHDVGATATTEYYLMVAMPINRPVFEEWTGTWCGWCTRGLKAMALLNEQVEDFIGVAYHNGDPMALKTGYPNMVEGFPSANINRSLSIDPYFGTGNSGFGAINDYLAAKAEFTPALMAIETEWADDSKNKINVKVTTDFVKPVEGTYALNYILVADGLTGTGSSWNQQNYYRTAANAGGDPNLLDVVSWGDPIKGFKFDDVAVQVSGFKTLSSSETNVDVVSEYAFNNLNSNTLIQNKDNLWVVVELIETAEGATYGKRILNGIKVRPGESETTGVGTLVSDSSVKSVEFFDLQGRKVVRPIDGIFVKVEKLNDGSSRSSKVVIK